MRANRWANVAALVLLLLTFAAVCFGGRLMVAEDETTGTPLSPVEYARVLTEVDTALKAPFGRLTGDKGQYPAVAESLRSGAQRLSATIPPDAAAPAHDALFAAMRTLAIVVDEAGRATPSCPAASPATVVLASTHATEVRARSKELAAADATFVFGTFLPPAPAEQNRRLRNGELIKAPKGDGAGSFGVESGPGIGDAAVSLVPEGSTTPLATMYVREGATAEMDGVPAGAYLVFMASGEDWDKARRGFTRECGFAKFTDTFDFEADGGGWTVTLTESRHGNAPTSDLKPEEFPAG